mmetsp:Transcript_12658/g.37948  ORF Transcript_12658/g.37948 Transcript_12658/m.37948 type:complete len:215 (+) Transcript_12658:485-1129(+)
MRFFQAAMSFSRLVAMAPSAASRRSLPLYFFCSRVKSLGTPERVSARRLMCATGSFCSASRIATTRCVWSPSMAARSQCLSTVSPSASTKRCSVSVRRVRQSAESSSRRVSKVTRRPAECAAIMSCTSFSAQAGTFRLPSFVSSRSSSTSSGVAKAPSRARRSASARVSVPSLSFGMCIFCSDMLAGPDTLCTGTISRRGCPFSCAPSACASAI